MKYRLATLLLMTLLSSTAHARFAKFVHVAPGIEKEQRSSAYSISTNPVLTIAQSDTNTFTVTIPLKGTRQHQQYWVIRCTSPVNKEQMNFRSYAWEYKRHERWVQRIQQDERLSREARSELIMKHPLKSRNDVEAIEPLSVSKEDRNIVVEIPESEIDRTYVYRDYPMMVTDGGYYYCFDLPAYYKKHQAEALQASGADAPQPEH